MSTTEPEEVKESSQWLILAHAFTIAATITNRTNIEEIHQLAKDIEETCKQGMTAIMNGER